MGEQHHVFFPFPPHTLHGCWASLSKLFCQHACRLVPFKSVSSGRPQHKDRTPWSLSCSSLVLEFHLCCVRLCASTPLMLTPHSRPHFHPLLAGLLIEYCACNTACTCVQHSMHSQPTLLWQSQINTGPCFVCALASVVCGGCRSVFSFACVTWRLFHLHALALLPVSLAAALWLPSACAFGMLCCVGTGGRHASSVCVRLCGGCSRQKNKSCAQLSTGGVCTGAHPPGRQKQAYRAASTSCHLVSAWLVFACVAKWQSIAL
jgi:hypothetical protein